MNHGPSHRLWQHAALAAGITLVLTVLGIVAILSWGRNQHIQPEMVEASVQRGMSVSDAEFAMGLAPGSLARHADVVDGWTHACVSDCGLGTLIVPQKRITLIFDKNGGLVSGQCEYGYQGDEAMALLKIER